MRLDQKIARMATCLGDDGINTARLDARLLACHGLGLSETDLILQFDKVLNDAEGQILDALLERRLRREPMAHILGVREFWGLPFFVTAATLVPRPDSETLVSALFDEISDRDQCLRLVDIGTGSGCLLLSILSGLPNAYGVGIDISEAALCVAQKNADHLDLAHRASFIQGDYANALDGEIDILMSNPPYLAQDEMQDLERDVADYDPAHALVSGQTGLEAYEAIFSTIGSWDEKPSVMAFEFGHKQAKDVLALAKKHRLVGDNDGNATLWKDLAGHDRVLLIRQKVDI